MVANILKHGIGGGMTVLIFKPANDEQEKNLEQFILFCKQQFNHQKRMHTWDENIWYKLGTFTKLKTKHWEDGNAMNLEFVDFAKSYIIYQRGLTRKKKFQREMVVLKYIEASLIKLKGSACITNCDTMV
ncbi:hypothetical protein LRD24_004859, partial [Salmonella enterica]|nr:hypothetical protein [Salmonella enterica]